MINKSTKMLLEVGILQGHDKWAARRIRTSVFSVNSLPTSATCHNKNCTINGFFRLALLFPTFIVL